MHEIIFTNQAIRDIPNLKVAKLDGKVKRLLDVLRQNPYQSPPPFEKLKGELQRAFSRRINIQRRLVYEILPEQNAIKIVQMWTHYD